MSAEGMRQAAVLLASLHWRDRVWMRRRLPGKWWKRLRQLSRELRSLTTDDAQMLRDALLEPLRTRPEPPPPDVLLAGLDGLSPAWVARALAACAPDHRDMLLSARPSTDQAAIDRALREGPTSLPPGLAQALTQLIRQRGERALAEMRP